ncbi:MAG TPA: universal stress protein [Thiobacillaceae bacterium]|nr:universal stress protein [Thiobacillaceae bacterium]HNU65110.1 universal stress protein [Thiobacillaceae bacterium]
MHDYRRILALVDFTHAGTSVARRALGLASLEGARLAFLHLIPPDPALDGGYPGPGRQTEAREFEQAALRRLDFLRGTLGAGEVELLARYGQAHRGFADGIRHWQPDLVVAEYDTGYLGGRHDLLTLGHRPARNGLARMLRHWLVPAGLLGNTG